VHADLRRALDVVVGETANAQLVSVADQAH
jgi:hypothetical protein